MAVIVREIMNRELLAFPADMSRSQAIWVLVAWDLSAAPVVDGEDQLVGIVNLRDLLRSDRPTVRDAATSGVRTIRAQDDIQSAAAELSKHGIHHLPVLGPKDALVGFLSTLDVVRGLTGAPASHPARFPHRDPLTGATFSDDLELTLEHVAQTPPSPGVIVLVRGGVGRPERVVWAETSSDVRSCARGYLERRGHQIPQLQQILAQGGLRFRIALLGRPEECERIAYLVRDQAQRGLP
jgi:CBS domain-containing protein